MIAETEPNALYAWIAVNGQIVFFFGQILFWMAIAGAAVWATLLYKRYVDFMTGVVKETDELIEGDPSDAAASESAADVDVDSFTE